MCHQNAVEERIQNTKENRVTAHDEILHTFLLVPLCTQFPIFPIFIAPDFFEGPREHSCGLFICEYAINRSSFCTPALCDGFGSGGACRTECGCFWHDGSCLVPFVGKGHHLDSAKNG